MHKYKVTFYKNKIHHEGSVFADNVTEAKNITMYHEGTNITKFKAEIIEGVA